MNFDIFGTVKDVITDQIHVVNVNIFTVHPEIIAIRLDMGHLDVTTIPKRFFGVGKVVMVQRDAAAAAKYLGCLNCTIVNFDIIGVPNPRSGHGFQNGMIDFDMGAVPKRVFLSKD